MEIHQKIWRPSYRKLKTMVKRSMDQKLRLRNFDTRNESIKTGEVVPNRRDQVVLKEDKEFAINGKQKDSVREETRVVSSTTGMNVQNRHQKPLHPLSHQHKEVQVHRGNRTSEAGVHLGSPIDSRAKTRGGSMSRKRSIRNGSNHGMILRQPCKYFLKGTCTISPCEYWHPPEC